MFPQSTPNLFVGQQGPNYNRRTAGEYQRPDVSTNSSIPMNPHQSRSQGSPYSTVCTNCWHQHQFYISYSQPNLSSINTTTVAHHHHHHHHHPPQSKQSHHHASDYNVYRSFHPSPAPHHSSIPNQSISTNATLPQSAIPSKPNVSVQEIPNLAAIKKEPQSPTNPNYTPPQSHPTTPQPTTIPQSYPSQPGVRETILSRPILTLPPPIDAKAVARPDPSQVMVTMSQSAYMNIISRLTKLEERSTTETSYKSTWNHGAQLELLAYEYHNLKERFCTLEEEMGELLERLDDNDERLEDLETDNEKAKKRWSAGQARHQRTDSGFATTPEYVLRPTSWSAPKDGDAVMQETEVVIKREPDTSAVDRLQSSPGRKRARSDVHDGEASYSKKRKDS